LPLLSTSQAKLARLAYIVNTAVDLSLSSSNNITSHPSQAQRDFCRAAELPLPAKPSSRIPLIYTAPVIVPVVIVELVLYPRPPLILCRWSPFPSNSVRALSGTTVPSGSHRSTRLTWVCFWYFVTHNHHNQGYRGLRGRLLRFTNCCLVANFFFLDTALSIRCDTYRAQPEELPSNSIGSQLLSFRRGRLLPRLLG
jgi:hypothetical protein